MRRLPALVAALLLPATPPLLLGTAALTGALLVSLAPAQAQSAEAVAKVAQAITVRIEGATQGSGVLVGAATGGRWVVSNRHVVGDQSTVCVVRPIVQPQQRWSCHNPGVRSRAAWT
jgi:hypothetical protein